MDSGPYRVTKKVLLRKKEISSCTNCDNRYGITMSRKSAVAILCFKSVVGAGDIQ